MSSRRDIITREAVNNLFSENEKDILKNDDNRHSNGPLVKLFRCLNYYLYKRKGNKTDECRHSITCWYIHAIEGAVRNFIYAFSLRLLSTFVMSNRKSIIRTLKGSKIGAAKITKNLIKSILSFNLVRSVKSLVTTVKALYSIEALILGVFVGGYVGWFRLILCQLRRYSNRDEGQKAALAAFISSLWLFIDRKRSRRIQIGWYIFARSLDSLLKAIDENGAYDRLVSKYAPYTPGYDYHENSSKRKNQKGKKSKQPGTFEIHWSMLFSCLLTLYVLYTWGYEIEHFPHGVERGMKIMTCPKPNDWNMIDKIGRVRGYLFYRSPMATSRYGTKIISPSMTA